MVIGEPPLERVYHLGSGDCRWDKGTIPFQIVQVLRDGLFFSRGWGHFGYDRIAALRVDDYPLTSQRYYSGLSSDRRICREIRQLMRVKQYGVIPEFMLSSHVLTRAGELVGVEKIVPLAVKALQKLCHEGSITVGAHGRSHLDERQYREGGKVGAAEFAHLPADEARVHLEDNIAWINRVFGVAPRSFVAPAWATSLGAKEVACRLFDYVCESEQKLEAGQSELFSQECASGCLILPETVRATSSSIDLASEGLWRAVFDAGIPAHFLAHGPYLFNPLGSKGRQWSMAAAAAAVVGAATMANCLSGPVAGIGAFAALAACLYVGRHFGGDLLRFTLATRAKWRRCMLEQVVVVASRAGATWLPLTNLGRLARAYNRMTIVRAGQVREHRSIEWTNTTALPPGIAYFVPQHVVKPVLDGRTVPGPIAGAISLGTLHTGPHRLDYVLPDGFPDRGA